MWQGEEEQGRERGECGDENDEDIHPGRRERERTSTDDITVVVTHEAGDYSKWSREEEGAEGEAAGNLVVHVRSGDIFVDPAHPLYGQPSLRYYLRAMERQRWARIDDITNGYEDEYHVINPVVPARAKMVSGALAGDVHFHKNRTMGEDLLSMLCGDGFVSAKSTVRHLVSRHSSATQMYFPHACDDELRDFGLGHPGI